MSYLAHVEEYADNCLGNEERGSGASIGLRYQLQQHMQRGLLHDDTIMVSVHDLDTDVISSVCECVQGRECVILILVRIISCYFWFS